MVRFEPRLCRIASGTEWGGSNVAVGRARRDNREQAIVGPYEPAAVRFQRHRATRAPDAGIDDAEHDRGGGQPRHERRDEMRARRDIESGCVVEKIDDRTLRCVHPEYRFHLTDVKVGRSEIGEEKNRSVHALVRLRAAGKLREDRRSPHSACKSAGAFAARCLFRACHSSGRPRSKLRR